MVVGAEEEDPALFVEAVSEVGALESFFALAICWGFRWLEFAGNSKARWCSVGWGPSDDAVIPG